MGDLAKLGGIKGILGLVDTCVVRPCANVNNFFVKWRQGEFLSCSECYVIVVKYLTAFFCITLE